LDTPQPTVTTDDVKSTVETTATTKKAGLTSKIMAALAVGAGTIASGLPM
jgi:hypothetical protein